jgi:hypothetical protein
MSQDETAARIQTLERGGWMRRFTAVGPRLQEAIDLYHGLGFEVRLESATARPEDSPDASACAQCFAMTLAQTIYTRPGMRPAVG